MTRETAARQYVRDSQRFDAGLALRKANVLLVRCSPTAVDSGFRRSFEFHYQGIETYAGGATRCMDRGAGHRQIREAGSIPRWPLSSGPVSGALSTHTG